MEPSTAERDPAHETLVVFGATGTTGSHVVRQALGKGMSVRAAVRSPDKLPAEFLNHDRLETVQVDVTDAAAVARAIPGSTLVFAALGYNGNPGQPVLLPFVHAVVAAMREHGVRRLVYQAAALNPEPARPNPFAIRLARSVIAWVLNTGSLWGEHDAVIRFLTQEVADLEWTATRPGRLSDGESQGVLTAGAVRGGGVTNRDLAAFSLDALITGAHARTCPYLRYQSLGPTMSSLSSS